MSNEYSLVHYEGRREVGEANQGRTTVSLGRLGWVAGTGGDFRARASAKRAITESSTMRGKRGHQPAVCRFQRDRHALALWPQRIGAQPLPSSRV